MFSISIFLIFFFGLFTYLYSKERDCIQFIVYTLQFVCFLKSAQKSFPNAQDGPCGPLIKNMTSPSCSTPSIYPETTYCTTISLNTDELAF